MAQADPEAETVINGTVLTVDHTRPTAEALAVADGRIIAVGTRSDVEGLIGPGTQTIDVGDGCVMPGFVEAHGHPLTEAVALSDRIVDIRPVTVPNADDVVGSLEVGKYADLVVLSTDPRTVRPEQIADLDVRATYLAGRQVYQQ